MGVEVEAAEEEEMKVCLGRGLGKDGLRIRTEWDRRGRCLGQREGRGKVLLGRGWWCWLSDKGNLEILKICEQEENFIPIS